MSSALTTLNEKRRIGLHLFIIFYRDGMSSRQVLSATPKTVSYRKVVVMLGEIVVIITNIQILRIVV